MFCTNTRIHTHDVLCTEYVLLCFILNTDDCVVLYRKCITVLCTQLNWLPSRFSLSVETRRRFGWLRMMVFPGAHLFRAPIWWPSGGWRHARGREHCRGEPGSSLSGGYAPDSAKAEGSSIVDEPGEG